LSNDGAKHANESAELHVLVCVAFAVPAVALKRTIHAVCRIE